MRPRGFQREFSPKAMVGVTVSDDLIPAVLLQFALCGDTLRVSCPILPLYPVANLIFPSISARNLNSTCDQLCQIPSYCRWKYPPPSPFSWWDPVTSHHPQLTMSSCLPRTLQTVHCSIKFWLSLTSELFRNVSRRSH